MDPLINDETIPVDFDIAAAVVLSNSQDDVAEKFSFILTSLIFLFYKTDVNKRMILRIIELIDVNAYRNCVSMFFPYTISKEMQESKDYLFKHLLFQFGDDFKIVRDRISNSALTAPIFRQLMIKYNIKPKKGFYDTIGHIQSIAIEEETLDPNDFKNQKPEDIASAFFVLTNTNSILLTRYALIYKELSESLSYKRDILISVLPFFSTPLSSLFIQSLMGNGYICEEDLKTFQLSTNSEIWRFRPLYLSKQDFEMQKMLDLNHDEITTLQENLNSSRITVNELTQNQIKLMNKINELKKQIILNKSKTEDLENKKVALHVDNFVVNKQILEKSYPLLHAMMQRYCDNKKELDILYSAGTCGKILGSACYQWLAQQLPFYDVSTIRRYIAPKVELMQESLQNIHKIKEIIQNFYHDNIPSIITLGGDAASIKPIDGNTQNSIYAFEILPLDGKLKPCVVHLEVVGTGSSPKTIKELFDSISIELNNLDITTKFRATDGDVSFDKIHDEWYREHIEKFGTFEEVLDHIITLDNIPISDFLHLLKCSRSHILNHLVMLVPDLLICLNIELMKENTDLDEALDDLSTSGRMKDAYPLAIFSWNTFIELINAGRYDACYYILPFIYMGTAIREEINTEERISLLKAAYQIFKNILKTVELNESNLLFPAKFSAGSLGTLFGSKNFLHRLINTCVGIAAGMRLGIDNLATQRISTHDLECFFGYMRLASSYNHSKEEAFRACINSILLRSEATLINQQISIRTRDNKGGIIITGDMECIPSTNIDWYKLHHIVYLLLCEKNIERDDLSYLKESINNIAILLNCEKVIMPTLFSGYGPTDRNIRYIQRLSYTPVMIPEINSPFDFFSDKKRYLNSLKTNDFKKWSGEIIKRLFNSKVYNSEPVQSTKRSRKQQLLDGTMREYQLLIESISSIIKSSNPVQRIDGEGRNLSVDDHIMPTNTDLIKILKSENAKNLSNFIQSIKKEDEDNISMSLHDLNAYYKEFIENAN